MFLSLIWPAMLVVGALAVEPPVATAESSAEPKFRVSVAQRDIYKSQEVMLLSLLYESHGLSMAGFEFTVETGTNLADIINIRPGKLIDSCGWEYFSAKPTSPDGKRWHIVSLARSTPGRATANCPGEEPISIAELVLKVQPPAIHTDSLYPIYFVWEDCSDNTISDTSGTSLFIGRTIEWLVPTTIWSETEPALTEGPPENCFANSPRPPAERIEFVGGGLVFRTITDSTTGIDTIPPADIEAIIIDSPK